MSKNYMNNFTSTGENIHHFTQYTACKEGFSISLEIRDTFLLETDHKAFIQSRSVQNREIASISRNYRQIPSQRLLADVTLSFPGSVPYDLARIYGWCLLPGD